VRSRLGRRPALLGALAVLLVALIAFGVIMSRSDLRRTGTNSHVFPTYVDVPPKGEVCAPHQYVPAGSGQVQLLMGTKGAQRGGPLDVSVRRGRRILSSGRSRAGYGDEAVVTKITTIAHALDGASVCARNTGSTVVEVYGDFLPAGDPAETVTSFSDPQPVVPRIDWFAPEPHSWWWTIGRVADRFGLVKPPFFGSWTFWLALAALLGISVAAIRLVVREPAP
jgi:hypothetical protein